MAAKKATRPETRRSQNPLSLKALREARANLDANEFEERWLADFERLELLWEHPARAGMLRLPPRMVSDLARLASRLAWFVHMQSERTDVLLRETEIVLRVVAMATTAFASKRDLAAFSLTFAALQRAGLGLPEEGAPAARGRRAKPATIRAKKIATTLDRLLLGRKSFDAADAHLARHVLLAICNEDPINPLREFVNVPTLKPEKRVDRAFAELLSSERCPDGEELVTAALEAVGYVRARDLFASESRRAKRAATVKD